MVYRLYIVFLLLNSRFWFVHFILILIGRKYRNLDFDLGHNPIKLNLNNSQGHVFQIREIPFSRVPLIGQKSFSFISPFSLCFQVEYFEVSRIPTWKNTKIINLYFSKFNSINSKNEVHVTRFSNFSFLSISINLHSLVWI